MGSNYEQLCRNNIPCRRIDVDHSQKEGSESPGTDKKVTKWPPRSQQNMQKDATHGQCENRTKVWKNPVLHNTDATLSACPGGNFHRDALDCACILEFPDSGYKSSQQRRSASHSQPDLALYTSFLPLWNSIALLSLFGSQSLIPSYRTLSQ